MTRNRRRAGGLAALPLRGAAGARLKRTAAPVAHLEGLTRIKASMTRIKAGLTRIKASE